MVYGTKSNTEIYQVCFWYIKHFAKLIPQYTITVTMHIAELLKGMDPESPEYYAELSKHVSNVRSENRKRKSAKTL